MADILHVIGSLNSGGVQRMILWLSRTDPMSRHRHSVVCLNAGSGSLEQEFRERGISVHECPLPWPPPFDWLPYRFFKWLRHYLKRTFPFRFARLLRRLDPDLVHTHESSHIHYQAGVVVRGTHKPWVWTIHGLYKPEGEVLAQWNKALRISSTGRTRVTAVSKSVAADFCVRTGSAPDAISVCYSAVDLNPFLAASQGPHGFREQYDIPACATVFGSVGRLVEQKAFDVFVAAAAILRQKASEVHFIIAGEGKARPELERQIASLKLQDIFHLAGNCDNVPGFLAELDVFVLPSRREGFGMALVEALAAGLPCIGARTGGIPEILGTDGGLIVEAESPEALANAMHSMLEPGMRATFRRRGPSIARAFSIQNCAKSFADIYGELILGSSSQDCTNCKTGASSALALC